ncbi:MAG: NAD-dependent epimerase/dehydratase family protein, partial [Planctomycetota bacterium]|nr:NAD-dependent epimerase/dehydratase family protein [Planctomycetota bacterium]
MSSSPPILVTGAAGFIGAEVCAALTGAGCRVLGLDDLSAGDEGRLADLPADLFELVVGDVRDRLLLGALLEEEPGVVLHLAARVGVRTVLEDPRGCEQENLEGVEVLAEALRAASASRPAPRVVAASTSEVYAESSAPRGEAAPLRPARAEGRWRYAASKRRAEELLDDAGLPRR